MKTKRILSMVLAIVLAVSLFAGVTGTAYADSNTITHTVTSGQYLYKICQSYGLTYDTCKDAIKILNGFTSDTQLNRIYVGQKIILPASDALAATVRTEVVIGNNSSSSSSSSTASSTSSTTTTTTTSSSDSVAYYLVQHTVQSGETLASICNSVGSNYSQYANTILTINGISSVTHVYAGKVVYIPVGTKPASGTYYTVVSHKVLSGETMSAICNSYGINYGTNKVLVSGLNDGANLNNIKIGQTVYVPTTKTVTSSTSSSTSSTTGITYAINISKTGTESGFAYATVNGSVVSSAAAGATVTMVASTSSSSSMKIEKVLRADTKAEIKVDEDTDSFTMPSCAVEVVVSFTPGLPISVGINKEKTTDPNNGYLDTYVGDSTVRFAAPGKTVTVKTIPDEGYVTSEITIVATISDNSEKPVKYEKVSNNTYTFKMPGLNDDGSIDTTVTGVKVTAKFAPPVNYTTKLYYDKDCSLTKTTMGSAKVLVDGSEVSSIAAGTIAVVKAEPKDGYAVKTVMYTAANGEDLQRATKLSDNEWTFTVPDYAKTSTEGEKTIDNVVVIFERADVHTIGTYAFCPMTTYVWDDKGTDDLTDDVLVATSTAKTGQEVYVTVSNTSGYLGSIDNIKYGNGSPVEFKSNVKLDKDKHPAYENQVFYEFTMPAADVTITSKLTKDDKTRYGFIDNGSDISYNTYLKDSNGNLTLQTVFAEGDTVVVKPTDSKRTAKVYTYGDKWNEISGGTFRMPACTVAIKVIADAQKVATISSIANQEWGSLVIYSDGVEVANSASETSGEIYTGTKVNFVVTTLSDKHVLEKILVYKDGAKVQENKVDVDALSYADGYPIEEAGSYTFEAIYTGDYDKTYDLVWDKNHTGGTINVAVGETTEATEAKPGDTVTITATPTTGSNYIIKSVTVDGAPLKADNGKYVFTMPYSDVSIDAEFVTAYLPKVIYDKDDPTVTSSKLGTAFLEVDGSKVESGAKIEAGKTVKVVTDPASANYIADSVKYKTSSGAYKNATKLSDNEWIFVMPEDAVTVAVTFTANNKHVIYTNANNSSYVTYRVKDSDTGNYVTTNSAKAGETVYVSISNDKYYTVNIDSIKYANGTAVVELSKDLTAGYYTFTMPAADVTVYTSVTKDTTNRFTVLHDSSSTANFITYRFDEDGNKIVTDTFAADEKVYLQGTDGSNALKYSLLLSSGYTQISDNHFTMPGNNITVKAELYDKDTVTISAVSTPAEGCLTVYSSGSPIADSASGSYGELYAGTKVTFNVKEIAGKVLDKIKIYRDGELLTDDKNVIDASSLNKEYTIEDYASYRFEAVYKDDQVASSYTLTYKDDPNVTVNTADPGDKWNAKTYQANDTIKLTVTPKDDNTVIAKLTTADGNVQEFPCEPNLDEGGTYAVEFTMPASDTKLEWVLAKQYSITKNIGTYESKYVSVDVADSAVAGETVGVTINTNDTFAKTNMKIIDLVVTSGSKTTRVNIGMNGQEGYATFTMPEGNVTLKVELGYTVTPPYFVCDGIAFKSSSAGPVDLQTADLANVNQTLKGVTPEDYVYVFLKLPEGKTADDVTVTCDNATVLWKESNTETHQPTAMANGYNYAIQYYGVSSDMTVQISIK